MTQIDKIKIRLLSFPKDFTWNELTKLLGNLGFKEFNKGKTSGSRVSFIHARYRTIILHKPHNPPILRSYQIKQIIEQLQDEGLL
ncbi:TPA: type II toxin-antitoxin system HicA family toxin [Legionella pneumophila]